MKFPKLSTYFFLFQAGGKLLPLECIEKDKKCDGINDCQNGSDEENCIYTCIDENEFQCLHENNQSLPLECIPKDQYCDGVKHCVNGEDEKDCPPPPENLIRKGGRNRPEKVLNSNQISKGKRNDNKTFL